jgi:hypothetical protein
MGFHILGVPSKLRHSTAIILFVVRLHEITNIRDIIVEGFGSQMLATFSTAGPSTPHCGDCKGA